MAKGKPRTVSYRRKRTLQTDYRKRLKLLTSGLPRIIVRITNTQLIAQLISFDPRGDKVVCAVRSSDLKKLGWPYATKNVSAAYLTGLLFGTKAVAQKHKRGILDTGFRQFMHGGRISAFSKGVIDAGMDVPLGEGVFPREERIKGEHVHAFMTSSTSAQRGKGNQFTQYLKNNLAPQMSAAVQAVKKRIMEAR